MALGWNAQAQPPFYISAQHHQLRSLILSHLLALTKALFPVSLFLYLSTNFVSWRASLVKRRITFLNETKQKKATRVFHATLYTYTYVTPLNSPLCTLFFAYFPACMASLNNLSAKIILSDCKDMHPLHPPILYKRGIYYNVFQALIPHTI